MFIRKQILIKVSSLIYDIVKIYSTVILGQKYFLKSEYGKETSICNIDVNIVFTAVLNLNVFTSELKYDTLTLKSLGSRFFTSFLKKSLVLTKATFI